MAPRVLLRKATLFGLGAALALLGHWLLAPLRVPRIVDFRPLTGGSHGRLGVPTTDGERVYFTFREGLETRQMALSGGASAPVKVPFPVGYVVDASKARSSLLMVGWDDPTARLAFEDPLWEGPLWSVPMPAGGARKMGLDASWAAWSPDGQRLGFVRYSLPSQLAVARADGSGASVLFESSDHLTWVRWSPEGTRLRFGLQEAATAQHWIMEIPASGGTARRLYRGFRGDWSPDGRAFIFSTAGASAGWGSASGAGAEGRVDLVAAMEPPAWRPWAKTRFEQLTFGPMNMRMAAFAPESRGLVAWGSDWHGQLMRYDARASRFEPLLASLAAGFVDYSRDGRWIVWVDVRELTLWRSRSDGSEPLQLTTAPMAVGVVRWSPDGRQLAFVGKPPDSLPRIYVMPSDGGVVEPISPAEKGQVWDPCWMPDGKSVVWGRIEGAGIRTFDLQTRKLAVLPQTDDLFYPKCSSQGLLLALTQPRDRPATFWTYDPHSGRREDLGVPVTLAYPTFARDGESVIGCSIAAPGIYRFSLRERRLERLADLGGIKTASPLFSSCWVGLDPDDAPIVLSDTSTYEVYSLAWERP